MLNLFAGTHWLRYIVRLVCYGRLTGSIQLSAIAVLMVFCVSGAMELQAQDTNRGRGPTRVGSDGSSRSRSRAQIQRQMAEQRASVFIENRGQWNSAARFLLRGEGIDTWVMADGVVYDFHRIDKADDNARDPDRDRLKSLGLRSHHLPPVVRRRGQVITLTFDNSSESATVYGSEQFKGRYNYFRGNDRSKWASNVATYGRVVTGGLYPGIDMVHYVDEGSPRYDLVVHPGARPSDIRMRVKGTARVRVNRQGELVMESSMGDLYQGRPFAYQEKNGKRVQVSCAFETSSDGRVRFDVGAYDVSRPLVIDPIVYSTYLGGNHNDLAHDIAVGANEDVYLVGYTMSSDFPVTPGAYDQLSNSDWDALVSKVSADGTTLLFSTLFGGNGSDLGISLALDSSQNVYFTGSTLSDNLPVVDTNTFDSTYNNHSDAFVARLSADGSTLMSMTYLGGSGTEWCNGLVLAGNGNVCVVGIADSTHPGAAFPTTAGAFSVNRGGMKDGFVTMLNPTLSTLVFSTYLGGTGNDFADGIAIDASGDLYIAGGSESLDFPTTPNAYQPANTGLADVTVSKLSASGDSLLYATYIGGSSYDRALAIALDSVNAAYVTGFTMSSDYPVTPGSGSFDTTANALSAYHE